MAIDDKVRENFCRRQAKRLGIELRKSRIRKTNIDDWGGYMLLDANANIILAGEKFDLSISDVEHFLSETEAHLREVQQGKRI